MREWTSFVVRGGACTDDHRVGERLHTFEVTHKLLSETRAPIAKLVSHSFPLARYRDALGAAAHRGASGALKVLLTPN